MFEIAALLLVASLVALVCGSMRWSLGSLMAAVLLLSPLVFVVLLLLLGGGLYYLNKTRKD